MSSLPNSKDMHARAAQSAKETRSTLVALSAGAIGALFFIATRSIEPALMLPDKVALLGTIVLMVGALGAAIWFGYCDAQWSYWWGVELDSDRTSDEVFSARARKKRWHALMAGSEKAMLLLFVLGAVAGGAFVMCRTLLPHP